ncbi:phosphoribosyltransferase [Sphingomonas ginsenosidivorax]|uniref:Phosphoribosyltransferase n=1 Tax=Sphingomonas ginsenosidivorax TaxID=862135 RepID=A0A5C6UIC8_9SPHN|nr:phosphoribosyltransferase domain-containing protein [Sphingomonas ginsenosidivorax]TXC71825.1 phosphoribosyltransferase [Sphingomonas ginsenosidivorax]
MPIFTPIPQDEFVAAVHTLAAKLAADTDWKPDFIIGIGRGGLVPAVFLSHATGLSTLSVDFSSQVKDFADAPLVKLAARTQAGERLLFVDDINDSGRTITHLRRALADAGAVDGAVRFAMLIDNISSAERIDYTARQIDRHVTKDWFVFPWEAVAPAAAIELDATAVPDRIA